MKILIIEDEPDVLSSISTYLRQQGFVCEEASTYIEAETKLAGYNYEIVILDLMLPDGNGLNLLEWLKKEQPETGILIVSAKDALDDKLKGLDLGADDYITKPFHLAELNSRVHAIIRRRNFQGKMKITFHEITVDPDAHDVVVNEQPVELTKKEYDLLVYFIINKNRVLGKEAIAEHLWGDDLDLVDSFDFIYTHIKNLRKKIMNAGGKDYVKTAYGIGYKFSDQ